MGIKGYAIILGSFLVGVGAASLFFFAFPRKAVDVPVSLNHKAVGAAHLTYNFIGIVTEISPLGEGRTLIKLDTTDTETPDLVVSGSTTIYKIEEDGSQPLTTIGELKLGSSATLAVHYDLKDKTWKVAILAFRP